MSLLTHLECSGCGAQSPAERLVNSCNRCGKPLLAKYDLEQGRRNLSREVQAPREESLWRYPELLPVAAGAPRITLGEGWTPLVRARRLGGELGLSDLWIKDESTNPTASFKARGMAMAVSRAVALGANSLSVPSAGNAGSALAAYAAVAGLPAHVYLPADVPAVFTAECRAYGAHSHLVEGLISDCGARAAADSAEHGRFDVSTLKEPYRLEGKKTLGYEIAEQLGWSLPDVIVYPTGGGTGLIGMWKAFEELEALGWIGAARPRMIAVQATGCAPIVRAMELGERTAEPWIDAHTCADGIRVPSAIADFLILRVIRESGGGAVAVEDEKMVHAARLIASTEGIFACPEGGATLAGLRTLLRAEGVGAGERIVLVNTGSGLKHAHLY